MSRWTFWSIFGVFALAVVGGAWFVTHFERVPTTTWEAPGKVAEQDHYLALNRFLTAMGRSVRKLDHAAALDTLPPGGTLLLASGRGWQLQQIKPQRAGAILDWVANGGYLIVEAASGDDPLLRRLGVIWRDTPGEDEEFGQCEAPGQNETSDQDQEGEADTIQVRIPGQARTLAMNASGNNLQATQPTPVWRAGPDGEHNRLLHFVHGRGQITVLDNFNILNNWSIGAHDHAELLWELLRRYQPDGEVWLAMRLDIPSLWQWLAESAWMVLISGGCLVAAWLWAIVPRFGGVVPVAEPDRRGLAEHLAAMGRAVWREGGLSAWADLARQDCWETLVRRHPHLSGLPEAERIQALARLAKLPPEQVAALFHPEAELTPATYTELIRTAQAFERHPHG